MISPPVGDGPLLPEGRRYVVELVGVRDLPDDATAAYEASYDAETRTLRLIFFGVIGALKTGG